MHKLVISDLGPIKHAEIDLCNYIVLTGAQASGKSTIAKTIYFFRTIKDDVLDLIRKKSSQYVFDASEFPKTLSSAVTAALREKFLNVFGSSWSMENTMTISYSYAENVSIKISLTEDYYNKPNYIKVDLSKTLLDFLKTQDKQIKAAIPNGIREQEIKSLKKELNELFSDPYEIVYIPAGRSMITLLASQLSYFYISLESSQRRTIDFCTRNYIEKIIGIRAEFERGLKGLAEGMLFDKKKNVLLGNAQQIVNNILHGYYTFSNGEERLYFNDNKYVKINFASSGQQEVIWILNLLYYSLLKGEKTFFVIEEPESHLFPEAQKLVIDLVALVANDNNEILVTTHSPYVLGAINNQLFASRFNKLNTSDADKVLSKDMRLDPKNINCLFVEKGSLLNCMDKELQIMDNSVIDGISSIINEQFDLLSEIEMKAESEE